MPTEPVAPIRRPRYRYVLFHVKSGGPLSRADFVQALRRAGGAERAWLTRYSGDYGILRCPRGDEETAKRLLTDRLAPLGIRVETLSTSGTIAALERRHPNLGLRGRD